MYADVSPGISGFFCLLPEPAGIQSPPGRCLHRIGNSLHPVSIRRSECQNQRVSRSAVFQLRLYHKPAPGMQGLLLDHSSASGIHGQPNIRSRRNERRQRNLYFLPGCAFPDQTSFSVIQEIGMTAGASLLPDKPQSILLMQRHGKPDADTVSRAAGDGSDGNPLVISGFHGHESGIVFIHHAAAGKSPAEGCRQCESVFPGPLLSQTGVFHCLIDIQRAFHTTFDLEAVHTGCLQKIQVIQDRQIPGAEQKGTGGLHRVTIFQQFILHAAGLSALAPVAGPLVADGGKLTLPGPGDAQSPMHKHFRLHVLHPGTGPDLFQGTLPGQHHTADIEFLQLFHLKRPVHRQLCAGMHFQCRKSVFQQMHQAQILNDQCIHPGFIQVPRLPVRGFHFFFEEDDVHGDVDFHSVQMGCGNDLLHFLQREIRGIGPGAKPGKSQIDCIGSGCQGCIKTVPAAGRSENLGHGDPSLHVQS